ncbi:hypothetical protein NEOLEDRAFT_601106 [Neolentinus lepideus HHB14362 ss-1]|uniref:Uncharacterized protein n=1 Tax=Neolentinus lepideus HHB14362 ss-1 TaxID=1314782 RepID=A0A165VBG7_9AGAM|nr:hypothetical protein NEOLEDRAFT_601106 [Neolentinus lepideus HHB14362 ss-1]
MSDAEGYQGNANLHAQQSRPSTAQSQQSALTSSLINQAPVARTSPAPVIGAPAPATQLHGTQPSAPATSTSGVSATQTFTAQAPRTEQAQANGAQSSQSVSNVYYSYPGFPYQDYRYVPYHQNYPNGAVQNVQGYAQLAPANAIQPRIVPVTADMQASQQSFRYRTWYAQDGQVTTHSSVNARPPSPRTPAKAEKKTLARDILRSLGRPTGRSLIPAEESSGVSKVAISIPTAQGSAVVEREMEERDSEPEAPMASLQILEDGQGATVALSTENLTASAEQLPSHRNQSLRPKRKRGSFFHDATGDNAGGKKQRLDDVALEDDRGPSQPPIAVLLDTSVDDSEVAKPHESISERSEAVTPTRSAVASPATSNMKTYSKLRSYAGQAGSQSQDSATPVKSVSQGSAAYSKGGNVPLFLPSPTGSRTGRSRGSTMDPEANGETPTSSRKAKQKKPRVFMDYVLVPPLLAPVVTRRKQKPISDSDSVILGDDYTGKIGREAVLPAHRDAIHPQRSSRRSHS